MLFSYKYVSHKYYEIKCILYLISYISSDNLITFKIM